MNNPLEDGLAQARPEISLARQNAPYSLAGLPADVVRRLREIERDLKARRKKVRRARRELRAAKAELVERHQRFRQRTHQAQQKLDARIRKHEDRLNERARVLREREQHVAELEAELARHRSELDREQAASAEQRAGFVRRIRELRSRLADRAGMLQQRDDHLAQQAQQLEQTEAEHQASAAALASLQAEHDRLREAHEAVTLELEQERAERDAERETHEVTLVDLLRKTDEYARREQTFQEQIHQLDAEHAAAVATLRQRLAETTARLEARDTALAAKERELQDHAQREHHSRDHAASLQGQIDQMTQEYQVAVESLARQVAELTGRLEATDRRLAERERQLDQSVRRAEHLRQTKETLEDDLSRMEAERDEAVHTLKRQGTPRTDDPAAHEKPHAEREAAVDSPREQGDERAQNPGQIVPSIDAPHETASREEGERAIPSAAGTDAVPGFQRRHPAQPADFVDANEAAALGAAHSYDPPPVPRRRRPRKTAHFSTAELAVSVAVAMLFYLFSGDPLFRVTSRITLSAADPSVFNACVTHAREQGLDVAQADPDQGWFDLVLETPDKAAGEGRVNEVAASLAAAFSHPSPDGAASPTLRCETAGVESLGRPRQQRTQQAAIAFAASLLLCLTLGTATEFLRFRRRPHRAVAA